MDGLIYPELPKEYVWGIDTDDTPCIRLAKYRGEMKGEQIAWYYSPDNGSMFEDKYECVSAPKGVFSSRLYFRAPANTEQEAIDTIYMFAMLGIKKDEAS